MDRSDFLKHQNAYLRGHISRRTFLGATGLGAAAAVVAACSPPTASVAPTPPLSAAPGGEPSAVPSIDPTADWTPLAA